MYVGRVGNRTARRYARAWSFVFARLPIGRRWVTLEVPGRRSGKITRFPLGMADVDGEWYLVSMLGECNWTRNVRAAAGRARLARGGRSEPVTLVEVPVAERAPIIKRYLEKVPGGRPHILVDRRQPVAAFAEIADRHPVYAVTHENEVPRIGVHKGMVHVSRTFEVAPAPTVVLAYLKDFANAEEWDPGTQRCVQTSTGPVGVGTTWDNSSKLYFIRTDLEYRLDRLEPDRVVFVGTNKTATSTDDIEVVAGGTGSRVTYTADVEFRGLAKLSSPVMQLIFNRLAGDTERGLRDALDGLTPGS